MLKTEVQQSIVITGARDNCTVSLRRGETIRIDIGSIGLDTSEAVEFCDELKKAVLVLLAENTKAKP